MERRCPVVEDVVQSHPQGVILELDRRSRGVRSRRGGRTGRLKDGDGVEFGSEQLGQRLPWLGGGNLATVQRGHGGP